MEEFKLELRKLIAVKLLDWCLVVMPECSFKTELSRIVAKDLVNGMD